MALQFAPHSVQIAQDDDPLSSRVSAMVQITPEKMSRVIDAGYPDLDRPHLIMANPDVVLKVGGRVYWGSRTFSIVKPQETYDLGLAGSHTSTIIEEMVSE